MHWRNSTERYGALSIGFHWLMLLLIAAVYASIEVHEVFPKGSALRESFKDWHYMLGLSVFVLVWLRLLINSLGSNPLIVPEPDKWQRRLSRLMHGVLYVLMIAMPIIGWLALSARGKPIPFFGLELPSLLSENRALFRLFKEIHEVAGTTGYFLIGLHAAAALFHHYWIRDNTLARMWPKTRY
jgi:cytochrome b561